MIIQLIKKDFLLNWKYIFLMVILCFVYPPILLRQLPREASACAGILSFIMMTFFAVLFTLLQAFQKEAMYLKASTWLCALPYSRRDLVLAKYLFFLFVYLFCCLIYRIEIFLFPALGSFGFSEIIPVFAGIVLLLGIYLPFQYRLGYEFTKYFFIFAILGISFLLPIFIRYLSPEFLTYQLQKGTLILLLLFSCILLSASAAVSVHFYRKVPLP